MASIKMIAMFIACMLIASAPIDTQATVSCGRVISSIRPCLNYLKGIGSLPVTCCNGVRAVNRGAQTTPDRKQACVCLKSAAGGISGLKSDLVEGLPRSCGVNIPYKISPSTDCTKVR